MMPWEHWAGRFRVPSHQTYSGRMYVGTPWVYERGLPSASAICYVLLTWCYHTRMNNKPADKDLQHIATSYLGNTAYWRLWSVSFQTLHIFETCRSLFWCWRQIFVWSYGRMTLQPVSESCLWLRAAWNTHIHVVTFGIVLSFIGNGSSSLLPAGNRSQRLST